MITAQEMPFEDMNWILRWYLFCFMWKNSEIETKMSFHVKQKKWSTKMYFSTTILFQGILANFLFGRGFVRLEVSISKFFGGWHFIEIAVKCIVESVRRRRCDIEESVKPNFFLMLSSYWRSSEDRAIRMGGWECIEWKNTWTGFLLFKRNSILLSARLIDKKRMK